MNHSLIGQSCAHEAEVFTFFKQHNRLPRLGDDRSPWTYRGWLLPYVILMHEHIPAVADRWGYHLRTLEAGKLLDEPIPRIAFGDPDKRVYTLLQDWSRLIGRDCGGWSDFRTLLDWLCWGLALEKESPRISSETSEKLYRQVNLQPLLEQPYDYLGEFVSMHKSSGWNPTAFFPTPHPVVELMVQMVRHEGNDKSRDPRSHSVNDPCVGSGRMLLHASNYSMHLYGQDIDSLAVIMCLINGALYAPWISFPLPDSIFCAQLLSPGSMMAMPAEPISSVRAGKSQPRTLFDA